MTRIVLICAGPTPWDVEGRIVGRHPLPLTDLARASIQSIVAKLPHDVAAIYRCRKNEACDQVARIVAERFKLRPHDASGLEEVDLGLWQGLLVSQAQFRFETAFNQWHENPLLVNPPSGEPLSSAIERINSALSRILKRDRDNTIALPLRPMAMRIVLGLLRREDHQTIALHLRNTSAIETIESPDEQQHPG